MRQLCDTVCCGSFKQHLSDSACTYILMGRCFHSRPHYISWGRRASKSMRQTLRCSAVTGNGKCTTLPVPLKCPLYDICLLLDQNGVTVCYSGVINGIDVHTQMLVAYFRSVTRIGAFKDFENDLSLYDQFIAAGNYRGNWISPTSSQDYIFAGAL